MASGFNLISWKWIAYSVLGQIVTAYYLSCEVFGGTAQVEQSGKKSEFVSFIMCLVICLIHNKCLEHFWLDVGNLLLLTIDCCHVYSGRALVNSIWELFLLLLEETFSSPTVLDEKTECWDQNKEDVSFLQYRIHKRLPLCVWQWYICVLYVCIYVCVCT